MRTWNQVTEKEYIILAALDDVALNLEVTDDNKLDNDILKKCYSTYKHCWYEKFSSENVLTTLHLISDMISEKEDIICSNHYI